MTLSGKILCVALVVTAALQVLKLFVPLINGWAALAFNFLLTALGFSVVFGVDGLWDALATFGCVVLVAAGIHGTFTKLSDYPSPHRNPTPSGIPPEGIN